MYDVLLGEVADALVHLVDELPGVLLLEGALGADLGFDVAAVTQLGDDVAVVGAGEDLQAVEHVGMLQSLQNIDF